MAETLYDLSLMQAKLDKTVVDNHKLHGVDLYEDRRRALIVELAELANELQFFKFWKKNKKPRTSLVCSACDGTGQHRSGDIECVVCWGSGKDTSKNPVLEEFIDCIHFILSILNNHPNYSKEKLKSLLDTVEPLHYTSVGYQFDALFSEISTNLYSNTEYVLRLLLGLGILIGISEKRIIIAYKEKNKINFERQERGY